MDIYYDQPAVYCMYDTDDFEHTKPVYIGKTTNIKKRIYHHFYVKKNGKMRKEQYDSIRHIRYVELKSELDAERLEAALIWKIKPKYNTFQPTGWSYGRHVDETKLRFQSYWCKLMNVERYETERAA